jgi:hypothetical protein
MMVAHRVTTFLVCPQLSRALIKATKQKEQGVHPRVGDTMGQAGGGWGAPGNHREELSGEAGISELYY